MRACAGGRACMLSYSMLTPDDRFCPQVYVWIYDPVHFKTFAMGLILGE